MIQLQNLFKIMDDYENIIIRTLDGTLIYDDIIYDFKCSNEFIEYSNVIVNRIEAINNSTLIILNT